MRFEAVHNLMKSMNAVQEQLLVEACEERDALKAERDALQAKVAELEKKLGDSKRPNGTTAEAQPVA